MLGHAEAESSLLSPHQLFQPPAEAESLKLVPFTLPSGLLFARMTVQSCCLVLVVAVVCAKSLQLCLTLCDPMDSSLPGPLSMGFSRPESWRGLPRPPPGHLPDPGTEPLSPASPAFPGRFFTTSATWEVGLLLLQKWNYTGYIYSVIYFCLFHPVIIA